MIQNLTRKAGKRRAIIHVGTEKTGTTSLQNVLAENRNWLRGHGILFPSSAGKVNHTRLVAAAEDKGVIDNIKAHIMAVRHETEDALRNNFRAAFRRELASNQPWHTVVLSSELVHSRLHNQSEIETLLSFVSDFVEDITILAVLRRQDQLAVSRFSTAIRAGHTGFDDVFEDISEHAYFWLPPDRNISDFQYYYDYENLVKRFAPFVSDSDLDLRLYHVDGGRTDPVQIISEVLDLDLHGPAAGFPALNPAMSAEAQFVIGQINRRIPSHLPTGKRDQRYIELKRRIEKELAGPARTVSRAEAEMFQKRFEQSNEALRVRFFPERPTLFDHDFSMYPETVQYDDFATRLEPVISQYVDSISRSPKRNSALNRTFGTFRKLWAD